MARKLTLKGRKLTPKQSVFVAEYQTDFNASRAAERAGYKGRVGEIGYQLLQKTPIKQAIDREIEERLRRLGVRSERVLGELARIAFHDIRKLYHPDGTLKSPHEWDNETAAAITGIEVLKEFEGRGENRGQIGVTKKVRAFDKVRALEMLSRHLNLFGGESDGAKVSVVVLDRTSIRKPVISG